MPSEKKNFGLQLRLNSDDSIYIGGEDGFRTDDVLNMENCRTGTTDSGVINTVESIGGTLLISGVQPSVTFLTIGSIEDTENNRLVKFQYNTTGPWHKIVCLYTDTNTEYDIILSSQVTGGLNFSKNSIIHSPVIINGYLIWPDGTNNQPRKVNIEAGIKANYPSFVTSQVAYTYPLNFSEITLIKRPPVIAPYGLKNTDGAFLGNFIANDSFEFAFQYVYYDNEETVTGVYSAASKLNIPTATNNYIAVFMSFLEIIPSTVKIVNLIVRYDNEINGTPTNNGNIVRSWDKTIAADAALIVLQNSGILQLEYDFYNNSVGQTLAPDDILRPYDLVPIYSRVAAAARNRLFLGNNTEGYDTPKTTSMTLALGNQITLSSTSQVTSLLSIKHRYLSPTVPTLEYAYSAWYVYITWLLPVGFYAITSTEQTVTNNPIYPTLPSAPTTAAISGLTYRGATLSDVITNTRPATFTQTNQNQYLNNGTNITITGGSVLEYNIYGQLMPYRAGRVFYDFAMRKCGVVTNNGIAATTPARNFSYTTAYTSLTWTLSNANAVNEIPDWAYYEAPVLTLNLRTRFFIESFTNAAKYATKDANGLYVFTSDLYIPNAVGIGLNTAALNQAGLGYSFTDGDICLLTKSDNTHYTLPVIGLVDNYIVVKIQNIGTLALTQFVFQIYSPYQTSDQEPYYEVGQINPILNPGTVDRQYSVLLGAFNADAFAISRNFQTFTYFGGAMSPNDLYYKRWDTDAGKPNYVTQLGQTTKGNFVRFSDVFIPGTSVNGLSTFRQGNEKDVPQDCGSISKLIVTSKVEGQQGNVMLSVCVVETTSMYIGEVQAIDSTGAAITLASDKVIGTINVLKGSAGTINPESAVEFRGRVWFYDANGGKWWQYSDNGLFPISSYKIERFWNLWSKQYRSMTAVQIEALASGNRPFVFTAVDSVHSELLISIPKLSNTPPKGYLPDYPSTVYPFDILDFQAKVIVFKLEIAGQLPHWQGAYTFYSENFITLQNKLYSFRFGLTYLLNQTTNYNQFYGVQNKSRIMGAVNIASEIPKVHDWVAIEANQLPTLTYLYNEVPYQQASDIVDYEYQQAEGVERATIRRNKLVPTAIGYNTNGLLTAEKMRSPAMMFMLEFSVSGNTPLELKYVNFGFTASKGFNKIIK